MHIEPKTASLRALLDGLFDYAGMFPPASLDLGHSIGNYVRYRGGVDQWMLRSFVCPARKLPELAADRALLQPSTDVRVSALGPPSQDLAGWIAGLDEAAEAAAHFNNRLDGRASVVSFELRLPHVLASTPSMLDRSLDALAAGAARHPEADYFVEVSPASDEPEAVADAFAAPRRRFRPDWGLKIRTGGVTPDAVPDSASIARFVCACRDRGLRFKATAGLHHPLRHFNTEIGGNMHGFLNLVLAAVAASVHSLDADAVANLLRISEPADIAWDNEEVRLDGLVLNVEDLRRLRNSLMISIGSCSFDDPRDDLVELDLARPIT